MNERELTIEDFYAVAEIYQIGVFELRLKERGYCLTSLATRDEFIFLKSGQNGLKWMETAYHELFHAFGMDEFEANAFRLIALIPATKLVDNSWLEENPTRYAYQLWKERLRVRFLFGI